jgi:D-3-phosphoglycerate dehydrogenase
VSEPVDALLLDLLEWIVKEERSYAEVMEAWCTSCPRLPVWEEVNDRGFVARECKNGGATVRVTAKGRALLDRRAPGAGRPTPPGDAPRTSMKMKAA